VLDEIAGLRERPAGRVRLVAPRLAARMVVGPKLELFTRRYPDVVLEITTDDSPLDLVAGRFDDPWRARDRRHGHVLRAAHSCECSRTGARLLPASFSITRAGDSSLRR
jgi:DNA-binding transcriptional LysR family regulator